MDLAETRPRTVLVAGAIGGVLLGGLVAAITPTSMIHAPDPPWRLSLPAQVGETAWVATASAPEDPAPRFADDRGYGGAGWSFPPALQAGWREQQLEPYPVPAYAAPASGPVLPSEAAPEAERTAREAARTAAAVTARAVAPSAEPAAPSEDEPIPVDSEG